MLTHTCVDCGPCPKEVYLGIDIPKGLFPQEEIEKAIEIIGGARLALPAPPGKGFLKVCTDEAAAKRARGKSPYAYSCIDEEPGGYRGSASCGDGGPRLGGCGGEPTDGEGWHMLLESLTASGGAAMCLVGKRAQVLNVGSIEKLCMLRIRCDFESDGRRFRKLAQCEPEWQLEFFDERPLQEERSLPYGCRHLRREDRTWLGHRDNWGRSSGSSHHLVGLDQLQLVKLARAGAADVWKRLIEKAYEGHPEDIT